MLFKSFAKVGVTALAIMGMMGMSMAEAQNMNNPQNKTEANESVAKTDSAPAPSLQMLDGPGMANVNYWKHKVLDGSWHAPEGTLELNFQGFDFDFGIYKAGEPDNFRWTKGRFYFDGSQNSQDRAVRYDLLFSDEPCIKDAEGKLMITLLEMWHENKSIYMKVQYPDAKEPVIKELRRMKDIRE